MDIVIDVGNSGAKAALFEEGKLKEHLRFEALQPEALKPLFDRYNVDRGLLSTVVALPDKTLEYLTNSLGSFHLFDDVTKTPLAIDYHTPGTLGKDRIAAAVGAEHLYPGEELLVVDAGTAITFDHVTASGCYKGGNISPGMKMRFDALHTLTDKLPLIDENGELPLLGNSTETAIRSGVVRGICYEMDGYIDALRNEVKHLSVFLTGGNAFYFEAKLKNRIFAEPNLVLIGLYRILLYNVK